MLRSKLKAFGVHFCISVIFMSLFIAYLYLYWFKDLFFITNVSEPLKLLIVVDVILGPLFTLLVYKVGKKTLKFDLSVIVMFQLVAFAYGAYSIHQGRPSLVVFNGDAFELVYHKELNDNIPAYQEKILFAIPQYFMIPSQYHVQGYAAYQNLNYIQPLSPENWSEVSRKQITLKQSAVLTNLSEYELLSVLAQKDLNENDVTFMQIKENNLYSVLVLETKSHEVVKTFATNY